MHGQMSTPATGASAPEAADRDGPLEKFFDPGSIAVIGASQEPARIGNRPIRYSLSAQFGGRIYPVNPRQTEIAGLTCYPEVGALPEVPDLAIVAVPAAAVVKAVEECVAVGIPSIIVFSSGFSEAGAPGAELQAQLSAAIAGTQTRLLGPNCLGTLNYHNGLRASFSLLMDSMEIEPGGIAFVTQSGAFGTYFLAQAAERGLKFGKWIATGNETDVSSAEIIRHFAGDPDVSLILGYMEAMNDGPALKEALAEARRRDKPVILLKAGRSQVGQDAAVSHTASMTGDNAMFDALCDAYDVVRASDTDHLLDLAEALSLDRAPQGPRVCVFTVSGGMGILMADRASEVGLELPEVPEHVQAALKKLVPFAGTRNPVDVTAQVANKPELLGQFLEVVLQTGAYDSAVVFLGHALLDASFQSDGLEQVLDSLSAGGIPAYMGGIGTDAVRGRLAERGVMLHASPTRLLDVAAALWPVGRRRAGGLPPAHGGEAVLLPLDGMVGTLGEADSRQIAQAIGIPVVRGEVVTSLDAALEAGEAIGYPVCLKVDSADIPHKAAVGGVELNVSSEDGVRRAYARILDNVRSNVPQAVVRGILVEKMAAPGLELIVGLRRDPALGPAVLFGMGGTVTEILEDRRVALVPVDPAGARTLLKGTRVGAALLQRESEETVDQLCLLLSQMSRAAESNPRLLELEVNPLVLQPGGHILALDALCVVAGEDDRDWGASLAGPRR